MTYIRQSIETWTILKLVHYQFLASTYHYFLVYFKFIHSWVVHKRKFGRTATYYIYVNYFYKNVKLCSDFYFTIFVHNMLCDFSDSYMICYQHIIQIIQLIIIYYRAINRDRTYNLLITNQPLYQLSYDGN